ncbi:MAG: hypothetical protein LBQ16_07420 [Gracilibacteraceae bacterium]|jgi:hypothetical protein|nr:hypothetical protein [Gracilibacteraceae bacterium]
MTDAMRHEADTAEYESAYRDARGYISNARKFMQEQAPDHVLVFNLASMALERYLVALCSLRGVMPENHNFTCLMDSAETVAEFPAELNADIRSLDTIFGICSLENYHHGTPEPADTERILVMCDRLADMLARSSAI